MPPSPPTPPSAGAGIDTDVVGAPVEGALPAKSTGTTYRIQAGLPVEDFLNSARAAIRDPRLQTLLAELESLNGAGEG